MKVCIFVLVSIFCIQACSLQKQLFDGNKPSFIQKGDAKWHYTNKVWTGSLLAGTGFIMETGSFENFVLELEFLPDSTINSGVFIRCQNHEINPTDCYEFNIWDLHPNQDYRTGSIVTKSKPLNHVNTINQWNSYKIEAKGDHLSAWINGILVADLVDNNLKQGCIALQAAESGKISFRNIRVKKI